MENPLYDAWHELYKDVPLAYGRRVWPEKAADLGRYMETLAALKTRVQYQYAWGIPDQAAIELLVKHSPIVEIGAGRGYWASLVQAAGGDVVCYDLNPPDRSDDNKWAPSEGKQTRFETISVVDKDVFTEVHEGGPEKVLEHQDRTLFLCWPPYNHPMAHECLVNYAGNTVIFVGEYGGCTGDDAFFEHLEEHFDEIEDVQIPVWECLHDSLSVYIRKT